MTDNTFDKSLASRIDHTLLKPDAGERSVLRLCDEARKYGFASVCVNPSWIRLCSSILRDVGPKVCTVIGFPLGATRTETKIRETEIALTDGAEEFDMVLHIGRLKDGDHAYVEQDIRQVVQLAKSGLDTAIIKVILETCLLTDEEIRQACSIVVNSGADFVKTSTGFSSGGATIEAVRLMKEQVGDYCKIKASGGIRSKADALAMIEAGASRIGASASVQIVQQHIA
jgi:deoxyribose-phosphate aldolase